MNDLLEYFDRMRQSYWYDYFQLLEIEQSLTGEGRDMIQYRKCQCAKMSRKYDQYYNEELEKIQNINGHGPAQIG